MEESKVFVLVIVLISAFGVIVKSQSLVIPAISGILNDYFAKNSGKVDLVFCGQNRESYEAEVQEILKHVRDPVAVTVIKCETNALESLRLKTSSILWFDSFEQFFENFDKIVWQSYKDRFIQHLMLYPNAKTNDFELVGNKFHTVHSKMGFSALNFLVDETKDSIDLISSETFTKEKCGEVQITAINRFERHSMKWKSDAFYLKKFRDFHGCELHGLMFYHGRVLKHNAIIAFSTMMNFKYVHHETEDEINWNNAFNENMYTFYFTNAYIRYDEPRACLTVPVTIQRASFLVPPGEPLTDFEKLMSPFDFDTWSWIFITLGSLFGLILITSFVSKRLKDLIFGEIIGSPSMNVLEVFFCGGQNRVPKRFYARFILLLILIWADRKSVV